MALSVKSAYVCSALACWAVLNILILQEVVILSDDEDDAPPKRVIKSEPSDIFAVPRPVPHSSKTIDLTDEALDETDIPRHFICWLEELQERAKVKPITVDQRLEVAIVSQDIIVIDDDDNGKRSETIPSLAPDAIAPDLTKIDSPSSDSGCVIMNREEVGIHSGNNFDHSQCSSDTGVDEEEAPIKAAAKFSDQIDQAAITNQVVPSATPAAAGADREQLLLTNKRESLTNKSTDPNGSKSSCSGMAAEQLVNDVTKTQKVADSEQGSSIGKTAPFVNVTAPRSDKFIKVVSTNRLTSEPVHESRESKDSLPPMMSPYMAVHKKMEELSFLKKSSYNTSRNGEGDTESYLDTNSSVNEDDEREFLNDVFCSQSTPIRTAAGKGSSVKVVHQTRHAHGGVSISDWNREGDVDYLQDLSKHRRLPVSVPLAAIRSSGLILRKPDQNERLESDNETNESEDEVMPLESRRLYTPVPNAVPLKSSLASKSHAHERTVRFADDVISNDTSEADEKIHHASLRRRHGKYDVPILDAAVPSTIQERKTYIKPAGAGAAPKTQQQKKATATRHSNVTPTVRSPPADLHSDLPLHAPYMPTTQPSHSSNTITAASVARQPSPVGNMLQSQQPASQSQQQQPYRVFISGTELNVDLSVIENPLSDSSTQKDLQLGQVTAAANLQTQSTATASFCESDNSLMINVTKQTCSSTSLATSAHLPAAIVHPLGHDMSTKQSNISSRSRPAVSHLPDPVTMPAVHLASLSEQPTSVDGGQPMDKLPTLPMHGGDGNAAELLEIYKKLRNHLEIMGYRPEEEASAQNASAAKRPRHQKDENENAHGPRQHRESGGEEMDEGDASLPFKKRRKLPVYSDTLHIIKEEDSDSQQPFDLESPSGAPSVQGEAEVDVTATSAPSPPAPVAAMQSHPQLPPTMAPAVDDSQPPIAHVECVSYPPTPMLSIANIVEYMPFRAYSTFKTPAPEIPPVRFNIVPQPVMINNSSNSAQSNSNASANNNHVEATFNIIPTQPQMSSNASSSSATATSILGQESEPYLASQMQSMGSEGTNSGFNVNPNPAIQYRQAFHPNQQYTYSIRPHQNANNIPPNFDLQNMFNLHNYQMNPQNYHNLIQNSRINLQEKQAILLNDFIQYDSNTPASQSQHHQQQSQSQPQPQTPLPQQQQMQSMQHLQSQQTKRMSPPMHQPSLQGQTAIPTAIPNEQSKPSVCGPLSNQRATISTPRTKAARKMVSETAASTNGPIIEKATKTNRVTRSSNRTTRAQTATTVEQKSPRRKTNRHK